MVSSQLESPLHHTPPSLFLGNDAAAQRLAFVPVTQARVNDPVREHAFIWTLAHELRQPLSTMSTAIAVVQHDSPSSATAHAIAIMGRQLRQMSRMVDDLLDAARLSSGKVSLMPEQLDIREVMTDAAADVAAAAADRGQRLDMQCGAATLWVNADRQRLYQVFSNLLNNAIKFTGPGGRITFTADSHASTIAVRVRDTGRGIDRMALPRIFDLFAQVQPAVLGGVGIGLSVVKEIVSLHRGRIEAHSDGPGKGSEFVVTLPVSPDERS
jgi:signal transduction histidine kinase